MTTRTERYEILETVQEGQFATSYRAKDRVLDRLVLLKVLSPRTATDHDLVQRFRREALLQARLKHPNIVTVYDFGAEDDFYIASEYIEGRALDRLLKEKGRLSLAELAPIASAVARALEYAHERGVVHRDLKPANIMIAHSGEAKLTDFGLAFCRDMGQLTQEGCVIGTPAYMSPEQSRGRRTDARTDIFSLGVVIYEALSGTNPFSADSIADSMSLVLNKEPEPLSELAPEVPDEVSGLVSRMLAKEPDSRPHDLGEVRRVFSTVVSGTDVSRQRMTRQVLVPSLVLVAAAAAAAALLDLRHKPQSLGAYRGPGAVSIAVPDSSSTAPESTKPQSPAGEGRPAATDSQRPAPPARAPAFCRTRISVSPWAEVSINGRSFGVTPFAEPLLLPLGRHVIELKNPYYPVLSKTVDISDSACTLSFDLNREFALLDIRVQPWAVVSIDGEPVDTTPLDRPVPVTLGRHSITLFHPELGTVEKGITADTAGRYRLVYDLTR